MAVFEKWKQQLGFGKIDFSFKVYALKLYDSQQFFFKAYLYRIIQELITNTIKHAQATQIFIELQEVGAQLFFTFKDNGSGLKKHLKTTTPFLGIKKRLRLLGGKMEIRSEEKEGITIKVTLPYREANF